MKNFLRFWIFSLCLASIWSCRPKQDKVKSTERIPHAIDTDADTRPTDLPSGSDPDQSGLPGASDGTDGASTPPEPKPPVIENPFSIENLSDAETKLIAARIGYIPGDGNPENRKCIGCHSNFNNIDELKRLFGSTFRAYDCFNQNVKTKTGADLVLNCLASLTDTTRSQAGDLSKVAYKQLGFMAAGVNHPIFREIFKTAEREAEYENFRGNTIMPLGKSPMQDQDFELLLSWVLNYYPNLTEYLSHDGPNTCQSADETMIGSKLKDYIRKMSIGGQGWEYINLARGLPMFACPNSDKHKCFSQSANQRDIFSLADTWKNAGQPGHIRILHQYDQYTSYWIRTSADGRFVGNGGSPSAIIDLQAKLEGKPARKISVEALYDPGFFPDNSGFMFQGEQHGSRICEQNILTDTDLITIDFLQLGCASSDLKIGLYQSIGNSIDSGDIRLLSSDYASDDGYYTNRDIPPLFGKSSNITLDTVRRVDGSSFEKLDSSSVPTPYHGSWIMSPANQIGVAVVSAAREKRAVHGGYRLFLIDENFIKNRQLPNWQDESTGLVCTAGGEKPNISFDERLLTYYRYAKQEQTTDSKESSSDIFVFDLLNGKAAIQITSMPKGFYAQFPHFRSDGWLYFTVYDANTGKRYLAATDIALAIAE